MAHRANEIAFLLIRCEGGEAADLCHYAIAERNAEQEVGIDRQWTKLICCIGKECRKARRRGIPQWEENDLSSSRKMVEQE
jgi:hypothetical protein